MDNLLQDSSGLFLNQVDLSKPMQYQESHPSVYVPKHAYKKYKMKHDINIRQSGCLDKIKIKSLRPEMYAICNLIKNHNYSLPRCPIVQSPEPN